MRSEHVNLKEVQRNWHAFGKKDPFWAILTYPDKKENQWGQDEFFDTGKKEIDGLMEYVRSLKIDYSRKRALDFGCGVGRLTLALAAHFDEVTGVDIAPSMIKLAKRYNRLGDRCKYYINQTESLTCFDDAKFDFVYSNIVLQHMRPQYSKRYIKELLRVLRPGGILVFQLPSERSNRPLPVETHTPEAQQQQFKTVIRMKRFIKPLIKPLISRRVLNTYYRLRYEERGPNMEMYGMKQEEVLQVLTENGAKILDVVQNQASGPYWISFQYCVEKA